MEVRTRVLAKLEMDPKCTQQKIVGEFQDTSRTHIGALCLICYHLELPQNKYFCKIKVNFAK